VETVENDVKQALKIGETSHRVGQRAQGTANAAQETATSAKTTANIAMRKTEEHEMKFQEHKTQLNRLMSTVEKLSSRSLRDESLDEENVAPLPEFRTVESPLRVQKQPTAVTDVHDTKNQAVSKITPKELCPPRIYWPISEIDASTTIVCFLG